VEAVTEIAAAEKGVANPVEAWKVGLGAEAVEGKNGMRIGHMGNDLLFGDWPERIQGDQVLIPGFQPLEAVHMVGQGYRRTAVRPGSSDNIPRGPGIGVGRHPGEVRMQVSLIGAVAPGTQQAAFVIGRVGQQPAGLIRMGGNHHSGQMFASSRQHGSGHATVTALNGHNIGSRKYFALELIEKRLDIGVAAAGHIVPLRMAVDGQQPMIVKKACEGEHGKPVHLHVRCRPDGSHHGEQILLPEASGKPEST
jgi:hypothetical protein